MNVIERPNRDALNKALDIYRDAMRPFIVRSLKKVRGKTVEDVIADSLRKKANEFHSFLQTNGGSVEAAIDIGDFPSLISRNWRQEVLGPQFTNDMTSQDKLRIIAQARNYAAHPGTVDLDSEYTRVRLSLISEVLEKINAPEQKIAVEDIRDRLFSDEPEEHLAEMSDRLAVVEAEKAELEAYHEAELKRLELEKAEYAELLDTVETEKIELEECLQTTSTRLEAVKKEKAACEKSLKMKSDQLKAEKAGLEVAKAENAELEERLAAREAPVPRNENMPDSVTFHGTTFTKHFDRYSVERDGITQSFWYYWQSQGREGKQKMRDAGWSVEKVDGEWEVIVSPEDFQAWIVREITELKRLFNSSQDEELLMRSTHLSSALTESVRLSSGRTSLPTGKEMEQPALEFLSDGREYPRIEIINMITEHFSLTKNQRHQLSRSGRVELYLRNKDLIERTRTGYYRITDLGLVVLRRNADDVRF